MVTFFLDSIVQTPYLTSLRDTIPMDTLDELKRSFPDYWEDWVLYLIGFTVCTAIGVVLFITLILAAFIFPCCRSCGNCGAGTYDKNGVSQGRDLPTQCCKIGWFVALGLVLVGLFLGMLPLFFLNESLHNQVRGKVFEDVNTSLQGVEEFLYQSSNDINDTIYPDYIQTETQVFKILDGIVEGSMKAIDDETHLLTTLQDLENYAQSLDSLQMELIASSQLSESLQTQSDRLAVELSSFQADFDSNVVCLSQLCEDVKTEVAGTAVVINFTRVITDLNVATTAINTTISSPFVNYVNEAVTEVENIEKLVNDSTYSSIESAKQESAKAKAEFQRFMRDLNQRIADLGVAQMQEEVTKVADNEIYRMIVEIVYWSTIALCSVIAVILALSVLGLVFGIVFSVAYSDDDRCTSNKKVGANLLMAGVALTFIFYWFYTMIVMSFFVAGGVTHTEFCRHIVNVQKKDSFDVLSMFDRWINESIQTDVEVLMFSTYNQCSYDVTLYRALNAETYWNVSELSERMNAEAAVIINDLKATQVNIPPVDLTNDQLILMLDETESVFGQNGLVDFSAMQSSIDGHVTSPQLTYLKNRLSELQSNDSQTDLTPYKDVLDDMEQKYVQPISAGRDVLVIQLEDEESLVTSFSFSEAARTLEYSEAVINFNGSVIISKYINETADSIYLLLSEFSHRSATNVEDVIAKCFPLYNSITTAVDSACVGTLYPINGFWFSLGWCLAFFLAYLFLAVKVAGIFGHVFGPGERPSEPNDVRIQQYGDITMAYASSLTTDNQGIEKKTSFYNDLVKATDKQAYKSSVTSPVTSPMTSTTSLIGSAHPGDVNISMSSM